MTTTTTAARPTSAIPGPSGSPLLGVLPQLRRDVLGTFERLWREHGDVVAFRVGRMAVYQVSSASGIKYVLQDNHGNYRKSRAFEKLADMLGTGLFTSEGDAWLRQRRLMQPAFHRQRIEAFATTMTDEAAAMLERWQVHADAGTAFDLAREVTGLTLTIVTRTLFGTGIEDRDVQVVAEVLPPVLETLVRRTNDPTDVLEKLPTPANRRYRAGRRALDEIVRRIIRERRAEGGGGDDLLGMLMAARDEETGDAMSDAQLRDEVLTLFLAGHETTANLLAWAWVLLGRHAEARERVEHEVDSVLAGRTPTAADVRSLPYLGRVVQETLRLYPPAWATGRRPLRDDVVDGYAIPANRNVILNFYNLHRNPRYWTEPERFDADRFLPERSDGRPRSAHLPFGAGPRQCIGNSFALMEASLVLAAACARFRVELVPDHPIVPEATLTLRPKHGVVVRVRPRSG
jgi:cytochrome P450